MACAFTSALLALWFMMFVNSNDCAVVHIKLPNACTFKQEGKVTHIYKNNAVSVIRVKPKSYH